MCIEQIQIEENKVLKIFADDDGPNPRHKSYTDCNLGTMCAFHRRYDLGDEDVDYDADDYNSWDEMKDDIIVRENPVVILPLYLYDHSGITMNTTGFSCQWDSGQVGWIFTTMKRLDELGIKMTDEESFSEFKERIKSYLIGEVETYDQYLTGEVYRFEIHDNEGDYLESCGGFFGDDHEKSGLFEHAGYEPVKEETNEEN